MKPSPSQPTESAATDPAAAQSAPVAIENIEQLDAWLEGELASLEQNYRDYWTVESAWVSMGNRNGRR